MAVGAEPGRDSSGRETKGMLKEVQCLQLHLCAYAVFWRTSRKFCRKLLIWNLILDPPFAHCHKGWVLRICGLRASTRLDFDGRAEQFGRPQSSGGARASRGRKVLHRLQKKQGADGLAGAWGISLSRSALPPTAAAADGQQGKLKSQLERRPGCGRQRDGPHGTGSFPRHPHNPPVISKFITPPP